MASRPYLCASRGWHLFAVTALGTFFEEGNPAENTGKPGQGLGFYQPSHYALKENFKFLQLLTLVPKLAVSDTQKGRTMNRRPESPHNLPGIWCLQLPLNLKSLHRSRQGFNWFPVCLLRLKMTSKHNAIESRVP